MKLHKMAIFPGSLLVGLLITPLHADDTDIYVSARSDNAAPPLVMMTLDYRPNLGSTVCTKFNDACKEELGEKISGVLENRFTKNDTITLFDAMRGVYEVLFSQSLAGKDLQVGWMINHDNSCSGKNRSSWKSCSNGAYILQGFTDVDELVSSSDGSPSLLDKLWAMDAPQGNLSHAFQGKELYLELYRYLIGGEVLNAHLGYTDFGTNSSNNLLDPVDGSSPQTGDGQSFAWDTSIQKKGSGSTYQYISPFAADKDFTCSKLFAINTLFQVSQQEDDSDTELTASFSQGGLEMPSKSTFPGVISQLRSIDIASSETMSDGGSPPDGEQQLESYFITDKLNTTTNGYAEAGGTGFALELSDPKQLLTDLDNLFNEILSVSSTFVAASIPVNILNRTETVDSVYMALFQPDEQGRPFWPGNLKKLKIIERTFTDSETGESITRRILADQNGDDAIADDGRISHNALTLWTVADELPAADTDAGEIEGKDGRGVKRGGAGQNIPGILSGTTPGFRNIEAGARQLYTEQRGALINLDAGGSSALESNGDIQTLLGVDSASSPESEALSLIKWLRGYNSDNTVRNWLLGDPLHSRPVAFNYGAIDGYSETNPDIRIFMGTNDGFIHSFKNTETDGSQSGKEAWAYIPSELLKNTERLSENVAGTPLHPYGVDGEPVISAADSNNDGVLDKVTLYFGLRRGGQSYYSLDITDPDTPTFNWSITGGSADSPFEELGLTFSKPKKITVMVGSENVEALVFAGGYDGGWTDDYSARTGKDLDASASTTGNALFIVNADTGALIWKATGKSSCSSSSQVYCVSSMTHSIASDVATLDIDGDSSTDRVYVGDTGGNVWRFDIGKGDRSDWSAQKIGIFGGGEANTATDIRFFHAPDIVRTRDDNGSYDAIIIGSGDRANPKNNSPENALFMIKDRQLAHGSTVVPVRFNCDDSDCLVDITDFINDCDPSDSLCTEPDLTAGWYLPLQETGEKSLAAPLTAGGEIFFTTYLPNGKGGDSACAPSEGSGRLYIVSLAAGRPTRNLEGTIDDVALSEDDRYIDIGDGIPPGAVALDSDELLLPGAGVGGNNIVNISSKTRWRIYWYEKGMDKL